MTTKSITERFEEAILEGRSRDNVLVSSLLDRGADGEYFNATTRVLFTWFVKGAESVVVELPPERSAIDAWDYKELAAEAIEAAGGKVAS